MGPTSRLSATILRIVLLAPLLGLAACAEEPLNPQLRSSSVPVNSRAAPRQPVAPGLTISTFTSGEDAGLANAYLLAGSREAVLIDAVQTKREAVRLADWVERSGKTLTTVFITHAHPDHLLGLDVLTRRFPHARVVSTPNVAADVEKYGPGFFSIASRSQGDEGPTSWVVPRPVAGGTLRIEGTALQIVEHSGGESAHLATLYLSGSRTLFASDLVSNETHLYLREKRVDGWLQQLDGLEAWASTRIDRIYPGHGPPGGLALIGETRRYLEDFAAAVKTNLPEEAKRRMLARYPRHRLPRNLEASIPSFFPG